MTPFIKLIDRHPYLSFVLFFAGTWTLSWLSVVHWGTRFTNVITGEAFDVNASFLVMFTLIASLGPMVLLFSSVMICSTLKHRKK